MGLFGKATLKRMKHRRVTNQSLEGSVPTAHTQVAIGPGLRRARQERRNTNGIHFITEIQFKTGVATGIRRVDNW